MMLDTQTIKQQTDLFALVSPDTRLGKVGASEYAGPCPRCGGTDRFHVNTVKGWFCRTCTGEPDGTTGHWHDAIDYIMWRDGIDFIQAYKRLGGDTTISEADRERLKAERARAEAERKAHEQNQQQEKRVELDASQVWLDYYANLDKYDKRPLWHKRGLSDLWIDYFQVGYSPSRTFGAGDKTVTSPSLTIPTIRPTLTETGAFQGRDITWHCVGLVHRLLADETPGGKYRPHTSGLGKSLFNCDIYSEKILGPVLLVEGEIKAMVTWATMQDYVKDHKTILGGYTVVGVAGKSIKSDWLDELSHASQVVVCLDPDARREAESAARTIGTDRARILDLPGKIDDMILEGSLKPKALESLIRGSRRVM